MQNSDFRTRITSLYGSQTSSVVLSTHNSVLSTRIKRQYGFQPSPVVLCMQTATLALESHAVLWLVSIVPCPHLWFLHAKQRLLEPELYDSLWDPDHTTCNDSVISTRITLWVALICGFVRCKRATLEAQVCMGPRPHLFLCMQNSVPSIRITSLYGSLPSSVVFGCKTANLVQPDLQVSMGSRPHLWFCALKTATLELRIASLYGFQDLTCDFVHAKQRA